MHITFYGAVREVTGSMHLVGTANDHVLLDCGLHQGRRKEADQKNRILPFDASIVSNIVLSHAHIDHSGRIPLLTRNGLPGRVVCTRATADACRLLLPDSAHIQEQDARYLNYKTVRSALSQGPSVNGRPIGKRKYNALKKILKHGPQNINDQIIAELIARYRLNEVQPLYTLRDAETALERLDGVPYRHPVLVGRDLTCTFYEAGHILGSAISILKYQAGGRQWTIGYTGDLGRFDKPLLRNPCLDFDESDRRLDLLIMESTYGDREHEPLTDLKPALADALQKTWERGGCVVIPSFAFGRTQDLLYMIHQLYAEKAVHRMPVYVDSPLATGITTVFGEHPELYNQETQDTFLRNGKNPFDYPQVRYINSVEESMALMRQSRPHIVISASGMCEAGRVLHHLRYKIHNPRNTILVVGFMARNTLGRRIVDLSQAYAESGRAGEPPVVRILNKEYPLKAEVIQLGGFSAHGDKNELVRFLEESNLEVRRIALVHGEESQSLAFGTFLRSRGYNVEVPKCGQTLIVE